MQHNLVLIRGRGFSFKMAVQPGMMKGLLKIDQHESNR